MVRRGARLERTDATTLVRLSAWDPRSTWCPAAGPGPGKAGRRRCLPGARGQSRYPPELGGREVASQPAEKGGGRPRARAPRPAPPAPPAGLCEGGGKGRGRRRWPPSRAPRDGPRARRGAGRGRLALTSPAPWAAGGRRRFAQARPAKTPAWGGRRGLRGGGHAATASRSPRAGAATAKERVTGRAVSAAEEVRALVGLPPLRTMYSAHRPLIPASGAASRGLGMFGQ